MFPWLVHLSFPSVGWSAREIGLWTMQIRNHRHLYLSVICVPKSLPNASRVDEQTDGDAKVVASTGVIIGRDISLKIHYRLTTIELTGDAYEITYFPRSSH